MSEAHERVFDGVGLVEQTLAALDGPALVCDADRRVRGWNDALVEHAGVDAGVAGAAVDSVVDCDGDPLARALDAGEDATGRGTVGVDGGAVPCRVTCRPLEADGSVVGAVVTLGLGDDRDPAHSLLSGSVGGEGEYVYAVDASCRLRLVGGGVERAAGVDAGGLSGEHVSALAERGVVDEATVERITDWVDVLVTTDRTRATFDARVEVDGRESVLEHRLRAVRHRGETGGAVVVTRDVTERVETTEALRESHSRLSTIVDHLPVVMAVVDEDERIEHYQGVDGGTLSYDREEVLGADLTTFEAEYPEVVAYCRRALDGEELERTVEAGDRTLKCFFEPLALAGERDGMLVTAVDVTERVESERELTATTRRLQFALEGTKTGVWEWDPRTDEVIFDGQMEWLFCFEPGEFENEYDQAVDRIHPDDVDDMEAAVERGLEDGSYEAEFRVHVDGTTERWIRARGEVYRGEDGSTRMIGICTDITDRKERERELREERERFEKLLETSPVGITILDSDGEIIRANERAEDVLGLSRSEITDRTYDDPEWSIVDEDGATIPSEELPFSRVMETGEPVFEYEHGIEWPDGTERWLSMNLAPLVRGGDIERVISVITDVTERRERQRKIRESQEKLRAVVDNSPYPILMKDREGRYQLVNDAAAEYTDLSKEEYIGKTPTELFGPEHGEQVRERSQHVLETGEPETVEETYGPVGDERVFLTTRTPFYGPDGEIRGTLSISRDVTERQRQQERLETLSRIQQLIHESVGALAAATTQAEIKATVCERLAGSPFYEFAWIGERDPSSGEIVPEYWEEVAGDYLDETTVTVDPGERGRGPGGRAYRSGDVAVSDVDDPDFAPWREAAIERGVRSVAAVPLTHGSTTHGILAVYADRPDAFGEREIAGFEALGEVVGFALSAAQNRRLLESETVLKLVFHAEPEEPAFRTATVDLGCRLVFDGVVGTGDGKTLCYMTVDGADPEDLEPAVEAAERVERATRLDGSDGPHFELAVADSTFQLLADAGARGTRIVIERGHSRIVAEAPTDVDVRRVREALETNYRDVEFGTRTEVEPTELEWVPTGDDVGTRLTDRQRSVLRAAYYSGYYDWPRETDAETLADSLEVATSTVLQHLRRGHRRVMSELFDS